MAEAGCAVVSWTSILVRSTSRLTDPHALSSLVVVLSHPPVYCTLYCSGFPVAPWRCIQLNRSTPRALNLLSKLSRHAALNHVAGLSLSKAVAGAISERLAAQYDIFLLGAHGLEAHSEPAQVGARPPRISVLDSPAACSFTTSLSAEVIRPCR